MSTIAVDTSALLAVLLNESSRSDLIAATDGASLVGPPSLPWEVGNALIAAARKKRLTPEEVDRAWKSFSQVSVRLAEIDVASALKLAMSAGVYAYDAYVLETARQERAPLLTLDAGLQRAARAAGVALLELAE